ncbi:MAG: FHA domain-containing protein [Acidobacteriota bacterium]
MPEGAVSLPGPIRVLAAGVIGRGEDADYRLEHSSVSRRHCRIDPLADCLELIDLGSRNGTWLNAIRIHEGRMRVGDQLGIGAFKFVLKKGGDDGELILEATSTTDPDSPGETTRPQALVGESPSEAGEGEASRALSALRERLGCTATALVESSPSGSVIIAQSAAGRFVLSSTVIRHVGKTGKAIWAPRDFVQRSASMDGLVATAVGCQPVSIQGDRQRLVYTYWPAGCDHPERVESVVASMVVPLGLDTLAHVCRRVRKLG